MGLGNPGETYKNTRHNVGARWVRSIAERFGISIKPSRSFHGEVGRGSLLGHDVRLLIPTTYMNKSGLSTSAYVRYFDIDPNEMLVISDEIAFDPGNTRFKMRGGPNGHNGLRSIIAYLGGNEDFKRLRIGVGHPGDVESMTPYLTKAKMSSNERELVEWSSHMNDELLGWLLEGDWERVMTALHSRKPEVQ